MQNIIKTQDTKTLAEDLIRIKEAKSSSDLVDIFEKYKIADIIGVQQLVNAIAFEQAKRILEDVILRGVTKEVMEKQCKINYIGKRLAKIFGKKIITGDIDCEMTAYVWRGKFYIDGIKYYGN